MTWLSSILNILGSLAKPFSMRWERWEKGAEYRAKKKRLKKRIERAIETERLFRAWERAAGKAKDEALSRYIEHLNRSDD